MDNMLDLICAQSKCFSELDSIFDKTGVIGNVVFRFLEFKSYPTAEVKRDSKRSNEGKELAIKQKGKKQSRFVTLIVKQFIFLANNF